MKIMYAIHLYDVIVGFFDTEHVRYHAEHHVGYHTQQQTAAHDDFPRYDIPLLLLAAGVRFRGRYFLDIRYRACWREYVPFTPTVLHNCYISRPQVDTYHPGRSEVWET